MSPTGDFLEDVVGFDGPDERFWIGVVIVQVVLDSGFKIGEPVPGAGATRPKTEGASRREVGELGPVFS